MSEKADMDTAINAENFYKIASIEDCVKNLRRRFFRYKLVFVAEVALILLIAANIILRLHWPIPVVIALAVLTVLGLIFLNGCKMVLYQLPESILYNDCDPEKYAILLQMLSNQAGKKQKLLLDIQLCSTLYAAGCFEEARKVLVSIEPKIRSGMATFVIDLHAKLDVAEDDYSRFPEYKERLRNMYEQYKTNDKALAQIIGTLDSVEFYINLHKGKLDECRKTLQIWNSVSTNPYQKVYTKFLIGKVNLNSDPTVAEECLRYVVEHGNTMYQKKLAAELLENLYTCVEASETAASGVM